MSGKPEIHDVSLRVRGGNEALIKTFVLVKQGRLEVLEARISRDGELHEVAMRLSGPEAKVRWFVEKAKGLPYYLEVRKL